jgi:hypothetical protein
LPLEQAATATAHMDAYPKCRDRLAVARELISGVDDLLHSYVEVPDPHAALVRTLQTEGTPVAARLIARVTEAGNVATSARPGPVPVGRHRWGGPLRLAVAGVGLAAALVAAFLFSTMLTPSPGSRGGGPSGGNSDFLPAGKVRHIVYQTRSQAVGTVTPTAHGGSEQDYLITTTREIWLTAGKDHPLMFSLDKYSGCCAEGWSLVDDEGVWTYIPPVTSAPSVGPTPAVRNIPWENKVFKTSYDPLHLQGYLPDRSLLDELLQQPNATQTGNDSVNGRDALVVESLDNLYRLVDVTSGTGGWSDPASILAFSQWPGSNTGYPLVGGNKYQAYNSLGTPLPGPTMDRLKLRTPVVVVSSFVPRGASGGQVTGAPDLANVTHVDLHIWFERDTYRVLQVEGVYRQPNGVTWQATGSIVKDELLGMSEIPDGIFTLREPPGASVEDAYYVFYQPFIPASQADDTQPMLLYGKR